MAFQTTRDWGTLPEQVENVLTTWGYHVRWFENVTLERLEQLNQSSFPVLAFVRTVDLTRTSGGSLHALIIVDVDDHSVISLDPELDEELKFDLSEFLRIWSRLNYQGMVIWR